MCEIRFEEAKLECGWLMLKPHRDDLGAAMKFIRGFQAGKLYQAVLKRFQKKRSLDANAYAWVLMHRIAEAVRSTPEEVYRRLIPDVGSNFIPMCVLERDMERFRESWERNGIGWVTQDMGLSQVKGCHTVFAYYGSSQFDSRQMSRLIELIVQDCKSLGIETLTPRELSLLTEAWDA